jgi:radical SAM-linked protein
MTDDGLVLYRLRVRYQKDGRLAYLGHLEVINTINRCIRRSDVPFSVGNGFARRIRLQFSQALPVGASSCCEYYDLMVTRRMPEAQALASLAAATPRALGPTAVAYLPRKVPALEAWAQRSAWELDLLGTGLDAGAFDAAVAELKAESTLKYMRGDKPKRIELSDALVSWQTSRLGQGDGLRMALDTRSSNEGALRPAILVQAALARPELAGASMRALRVKRVGLWHEEENGHLVEPLQF